MNTAYMRWSVLIDDEPVYLHPCNKYTFKWKTKDDNVFHRLELSNPLTFGGRHHPDEYSLLKSINDDPIGRYEPHTIIHELKIAGQWQELWRGEFCGNDMDPVNECDCQITFKPSVVDGYSCILDSWDQQFNIIQAEPVKTVKAPRFLPFEFTTCRPAAECVDLAERWALFYENTDVDDIRIYWREYRIVPCIAGDPQPPNDDSGWLMLEDNCAIDGTAKYVNFPPSLPGPPEMVQGHCEYVNGVLTAFPPPNPETLAVTFGEIDDDPPVIVGPEAVFRNFPTGNILGMKYKVKHPRSGSTYQWVLTSGMIISSGQGSSEITVNLPSGSTLTAFDVDVTETPSCFAPVAATQFAVTIIADQNWIGTNVNAHLFAADMYAPVEAKVGDYVEVKLGFSVPGKPTRWETINPGLFQVTSYTDQKAVVKILTNSTDAQVRFGYESEDVGIPIWSPWLTIATVLAPIADPVSGPTRVCNGDIVTYTVPVKSSVTLNWSFPVGWFIQETGPGYVTVLFNGEDGNVVSTQTLDISAQYVLASDCEIDVLPWFWVYDDEDFTEHDTGRFLTDVLDYLLRKTCSLQDSDPSFISDFLQYSPVNPSGTNYVTGLANKLTRLTVHSKGDILHPTFNEMTRIIKYRLKEFIYVLTNVLNVKWRMDGPSMRLEHLSFFDAVEVVDISDRMPSCTYKYDKAELDRAEFFKFEEGANADFLGMPIFYDLQGPAPRTKHPAVGDETKEIAVSEVSTDMPFIINANDDEVDRSGIVILQNRQLDDGTLWVEQEPGALTGMNLPNVHMGWANLHRNYFRHGRSLNFGYMNDVHTVFTGQKHIKKEDGAFGMCPADLFAFDPAKRYKTRVGEKGKVNEAELDFFNDQIKLKLAHEPVSAQPEES